MAEIVVTGAAGFIGSHVCDALLRRGDAVRAIDNFDPFYDPATKRRNLAELVGNERFCLHEVDIRDAAAVERVLTSDVSAVIHLAARAGVRPSIAEPVLYEQVNVGGTGVLLEAARRAGSARFIFASSSSVYGNNRKVPFAEDDNVDFPISPYAATKKAGELIAHTYAHLYAMNITCLRFFTVYGPRQRPDLAIHKFARLIEAGRAIPVFGDGSTSRDYTFIDDIVDGVLRALDACTGYHIYNLGGSDPVSLRELIAALETALGKQAVIERQPMQPGDVERTYADLARVKAELGFAPRTRLADGLARFVEWLRAEG
jgi:UDP-glucuronate 4-epimerase